MRMLLFVAAAGAAALASEAAAQNCPAPRFEVTEFKVGGGNQGRGWIGGVSLADVDNDGDLDLYAAHGYDVTNRDPAQARPDRSMLYLNDGAGNFTAAEDSALSNADHYTSGSTWGDVDDDGDLDVMVATQVGKPDVFYRNLGGGRFERQELGPATTDAASNFTNSWADIDGDGDLDLYAGGPTLELNAEIPVYRNDGGEFVRVRGLPIGNGANNPGAVLWADYDNDGDQDLFVANSDILRVSGYPPAAVEHGVLYRNDGAWRFEATQGQGFADAAFPTASAAAADIDNDGDLDLYVGGYTFTPDKPDPALRSPLIREWIFRNDGQGRFNLDGGFVSPLHAEWPGGAGFADFDLDGDLDLLTSVYDEPLAVYVNDGTGRMAPLADPALAARASTFSSIATGDIDGDGDPDAFVGDWGETPGGNFVTLVRNVTAPCGAWLEIVLHSAAGAPNPPGARVTLVSRAADGRERRQLREAMAQTGFRGQGASPFLYGVPPGETVVRAEVRSPDGAAQTIDTPATNARTALRRGEGVSRPPTR